MTNKHDKAMTEKIRQLEQQLADERQRRQDAEQRAAYYRQYSTEPETVRKLRQENRELHSRLETAARISKYRHEVMPVLRPLSEGHNPRVGMEISEFMRQGWMIASTQIMPGSPAMMLVMLERRDDAPIRETAAPSPIGFEPAGQRPVASAESKLALAIQEQPRQRAAGEHEPRTVTGTIVSENELDYADAVRRFTAGEINLEELRLTGIARTALAIEARGGDPAAVARGFNEVQS